MKKVDHISQNFKLVLNQVSGRIPDIDFDECKNLFEHSEWVVGFEWFMISIAENDVDISKNEFSIIDEISEFILRKKWNSYEDVIYLETMKKIKSNNFCKWK